MREFDEIMRLATAQSMPAAFISAVWAYAAKLQRYWALFLCPIVREGNR